jgi:hypothetical protein
LASEISAFDLERYKRARVDAGVTVMVNRELACLKTLYNRCLEWGKYEGDSESHRAGSGSSRPMRRESSSAPPVSYCAR